MTPDPAHKVEIVYKRPNRSRAIRESQKAASRAADEQALADGVEPAELEAKNAFITSKRTIVHWNRSGPL